MLKVQVKILTPGAKVCQSYQHDAGLDLTSTVSLTMVSGQVELIPTGIAVAIPVGYYGQIHERSSVALQGIGVGGGWTRYMRVDPDLPDEKICELNVGGGVIDAGYRGEVHVILINNSQHAYAIKAGDKIAQLIVKKICDRFEIVDDLPPAERGSAGFGSSGE